MKPFSDFAAAALLFALLLICIKDAHYVIATVAYIGCIYFAFRVVEGMR